MSDQQTVEYFNQHMIEYDLGRFGYTVEFIKRHAGVESTLIDLGCGTGNVLEYIAYKTPVRNIFGLDVAPNYVAKTQERVGCEVFLGSILDIDFIESVPRKFDFVLMSAVLHHLIGNTRKQSRDKAKLALKNALKLVDRDGYLIVVEPTFYPALAMDVLFYVKRFVTEFTSGRVQLLNEWNNIGAPVVSYYTHNELCRMIEHTGMCNIVGQEEIRDQVINILWRAIGITRRASTTIVAQKNIGMLED